MNSPDFILKIPPILDDRTSKMQKSKSVNSDHFELNQSVYVLPRLWWGVAMYGLSLSRAYAKLGQEATLTPSPVEETIYAHFLGSLLATSFELALKGLLISLDDPSGKRVCFQKTHDLCELWGCVPAEIQAEIGENTRKRNVNVSISEWFATHREFLSVADRYPEKPMNNNLKLKVKTIVNIWSDLFDNVMTEMAAIFNGIMGAMKPRYFPDGDGDQEMQEIRSVMEKFDGLQQTRDYWSHLWGMPLVSFANEIGPESTITASGRIVGYVLDVTMLEQGLNAQPRVVPRLWWIPAGLEGIREFMDEQKFNDFVDQELKKR